MQRLLAPPTPSRSYEVSRAVATTVAFRSFMTKLGFPQLRPAEVKNDNSVTVVKAASDASDKRSLYMKRRVKFIQECQRVLVKSSLSTCNQPRTVPTSSRSRGEHEGVRDATRRDSECAAHGCEPSRHRGGEDAFLGR